MTPKSAHKKGKDLENYVADQIKLKGIDRHASRSTGSGSSFREKADISTNFMILGRNAGIECKNHKKASIKDWWKQTTDLEKIGREPVLAYKLEGESYEETKVVVYLDTFLDLAKRSNEPRLLTDDNREQKWALQQLKQAISKVEKYLK